MKIVLQLLKYMSFVGVGLLLIMLYGILSGCSTNPTGPPPPILVADNFEEHVAMMRTPAHTAKWMDQFAKYSDPYTGWIWPEGKDLTWSLAHDLWMNYIKGYSRGKCGSFAAMQAYCSREHGYETGIIVWWRGSSGHAEAWIKEKGGYSIQSNLSYKKEKYKTYDEMLNDYRSMYVTKTGYLVMYDAYWNEDTREEYVYEEE